MVSVVTKTVQATLWTSRRYKAFHTTTTPLLFPGQLWRKGKKLSTKGTTIVHRSSTRSCMARSKIREAQQRAKSMNTATGAVFLPQSLADTGMLPLISVSIWTSSLGKWLANTRLFITLAFQKPMPCSDRSLHANGVTQLLGDGRLS